LKIRLITHSRSSNEATIGLEKGLDRALLALAFAQLSYRESLHDIESCS
jgi:hypothetical protein